MQFVIGHMHIMIMLQPGHKVEDSSRISSNPSDSTSHVLAFLSAWAQVVAQAYVAGTPTYSFT